MPAAVAIPPPVVAGSLAAGVEDDGMPKEDPSKLERAPGEENEKVCIRDLVVRASARPRFRVGMVDGRAYRGLVTRNASTPLCRHGKIRKDYPPRSS